MAQALYYFCRHS